MARIKAIALDAMGVIYTEGEDLWNLLAPFLSKHGCTQSDAEIHTLYVSCCLGEMTSQEFWKRAGCNWDGGALEDDYLSRYALTAGLMDFLKQMREMSIPVFCISNDIAEWAMKRRKAFGLEEYLTGWVISGNVGFRKPDLGISQALAKVLPCHPHECVFVDDRSRNIEGGREIGFLPLLFSSKPEGAGYPVVSNFRDLKTLVFG